MHGAANRKFAWSEMQILHSNADFAAGRGNSACGFKFDGSRRMGQVSFPRQQPNPVVADVTRYLPHPDSIPLGSLDPLEEQLSGKGLARC
jgi:hypothetical protein